MVIFFYNLKKNFYFYLFLFLLILLFSFFFFYIFQNLEYIFKDKILIKDIFGFNPFKKAKPFLADFIIFDDIEKEFFSNKDNFFPIPKNDFEKYLFFKSIDFLLNTNKTEINTLVGFPAVNCSN